MTAVIHCSVHKKFLISNTRAYIRTHCQSYSYSFIVIALWALQCKLYSTFHNIFKFIRKVCSFKLMPVCSSYSCSFAISRSLYLSRSVFMYLCISCSPSLVALSKMMFSLLICCNTTTCQQQQLHKHVCKLFFLSLFLFVRAVKTKTKLLA